MCLILLLTWLMRRHHLAAVHFVQALTCLGLASSVAFGDHPRLVCALNITLAVMYGVITVTYARGSRHWQGARSRPLPARHLLAANVLAGGGPARGRTGP